jgi:hypothetical protein
VVPTSSQEHLIVTIIFTVKHLHRETYAVRGFTDIGPDQPLGTTTVGRVVLGRWRRTDRLSGVTPPDWSRRHADVAPDDGRDAAVIA